MSKEWKAKRAQQTTVSREKEKERLKILEQRATAESASAAVKTEFCNALEKQNLIRNNNKMCMVKSRNKLKKDLSKGIPSALEKVEKTKKVRQILYSKYKSQDKVRIRKAIYRSRKRFEMIKRKIEGERIDINSRCINFRRSKMTPLGAAVRYCDLDAVKYILDRKASPTLRCISTLICTPLYDASWFGKPKVAQLLLEKSALPDGGATNGALHGAIFNRMFKTIRVMLSCECQVNEYYLQQTPLGAALTCGKRNMGDVRLVRILLSAKADIMKETKTCHSPFFKGSMVQPTHLARKYSNNRCRALLKTVMEQRKSQESRREISGPNCKNQL